MKSQIKFSCSFLTTLINYDITNLKYRIEKRACNDKQIEHEITLRLDIHKIWICI